MLWTETAAIDGLVSSWSENIYLPFCLQSPECALGLLVGGAIQVPQLQLQLQNWSKITVVTTVFITTLHDHLCSAERYLIVLSPTAPNSSYEEEYLDVSVEYSGPQVIKGTVPLRFSYAGNPDINAIRPKRIRNTYVYYLLCLLSLCINVCTICSRPYEWLYYYFWPRNVVKGAQGHFGNLRSTLQKNICTCQHHRQRSRAALL